RRSFFCAAYRTQLPKEKARMSGPLFGCGQRSEVLEDLGTLLLELRVGDQALVAQALQRAQAAFLLAIEGIGVRVTRRNHRRRHYSGGSGGRGDRRGRDRRTARCWHHERRRDRLRLVLLSQRLDRWQRHGDPVVAYQFRLAGRDAYEPDALR